MLSKCSLLLLLTVYTLLPYHFITFNDYYSLYVGQKKEKHTFDFLYVQHWKINNKDEFDFDFIGLLLVCNVYGSFSKMVKWSNVIRKLYMLASFKMTF